MQEKQDYQGRILGLGSRFDDAENIEVAYFSSATVFTREDGTVVSVEKTGRNDTYIVYHYTCRYDYAKRRHESRRTFEYYYDALHYAAGLLGVDTNGLADPQENSDA